MYTNKLKMSQLIAKSTRVILIQEREKKKKGKGNSKTHMHDKSYKVKITNDNYFKIIPRGRYVVEKKYR